MNRIHQILILIFVLLIFPRAIQAQAISVGIVTDASGNEFDLHTAQLKAEIKALTNAGDGAIFKELSANWQLEMANESLQTFLDDPEVDIIVTLGFLSSEAAIRLPAYPKPVIAAAVLDPQLQTLAVQPDNSSGIQGFAWIESLIRLKDDMHTFADIFKPDSLAVLIPQELYSEFQILTTYLTAKENNYRVLFVPIGKNENPVMQLPKGTDAAMVFPLIQHSSDATKSIFSDLNEQGIPSLSISGISYLKQGATITFTPQFTFQQMARQLAFRVVKASEGIDLGEISSGIEDLERPPIVNMESLRLTKSFPKWSDLENAVLLNVVKMPGEELTLYQAIAMALEDNLQGKISDQDLLIAEKDVRIARANVLPQVEISGMGVQLSKNLVEASMGQKGEFTITGSVALKQVIYSEAAYANIALKKLMEESAKQGNRQTTLDIVLDVSQAYITLLFAKNNLQIKNENVNATLKNLELAKAREKSGEGTVSDVNRWISELNLGRMDLNDAEAGYKAAMYKLNELLNQPIGKTIFTPEHIDISKTLVHNQQILDSYFSNPNLTEKYAGFLIKEMQEFSPELQQLNTAGELIDRQKTMKIRQMYLPEVALIGNADQAFVREGVIRNPQLPVPPPPDDITWYLGLRVSLPLFEGGKKRNEKQRATIEQEKIAWQKDDLLNKLEVGVRANVQFLQASYREMELSKAASRAADENFSAIQNAYAQGMVNVAQLADAQSVMIRTRQMALGSRYQYYVDYIKTERLQGKFIFLEEETQKTAYTRRLLDYLTEE